MSTTDGAGGSGGGGSNEEDVSPVQSRINELCKKLEIENKVRPPTLPITSYTRQRAT